MVKKKEKTAGSHLMSGPENDRTGGLALVLVQPFNIQGPWSAGPLRRKDYPSARQWEMHPEKERPNIATELSLHNPPWPQIISFGTLDDPARAPGRFLCKQIATGAKFPFPVDGRSSSGL